LVYGEVRIQTNKLVISSYGMDELVFSSGHLRWATTFCGETMAGTEQAEQAEAAQQTKQRSFCFGKVQGSTKKI
jgi:hypothetical protein